MARVTIKPIEPLVMEFADGTIKEALLNTEAFVNYTSEFGKLDSIEIEKMAKKPYDFIARFLYCGMKVIDKTVTFNEARMITIGGGESLATEVMNSVIDNFMATADEDSKKKFTVEMERIYNQLIQQ